MLAAILSFTAEGKKLAGQIERTLKEKGCETVREHFGKAEKTDVGTINCGEYSEGIISGQFREGSRQEGFVGETGNALEKRTAAEFTGRMFSQARILIFVGACGIAVRLIAPHVRDKKTDPAVLAVDEHGKYVVPILSGHLGGANRYARWLADALGATAVITTATDLGGRFAPDLFAEKYHFKIRSMKEAKAVAAAGLERDVEIVFDVPWEGKLPQEPGTFLRKDQKNQWERSLCGEDEKSEDRGCDPERDIDGRESGPGKRLDDREETPDQDALPRVLITNAKKTEMYDAPQCVLIPQNLILGIGCRRGTEAEKMISFLKEIFEQKNLATEAICAIASIDGKRDEPGLIAAAEAVGVPFYTYSAEELNSLSGTFTASEFVKRQMGTDNVCERSAAMTGIRWNGGREQERKKEQVERVEQAAGHAAQTERNPAEERGREGQPGRFLVRKQAKDGVTLAVYEVPVKLNHSDELTE